MVHRPSDKRTLNLTKARLTKYVQAANEIDVEPVEDAEAEDIEEMMENHRRVRANVAKERDNLNAHMEQWTSTRNGDESSKDEELYQKWTAEAKAATDEADHTVGILDGNIEELRKALAELRPRPTATTPRATRTPNDNFSTPYNTAPANANVEEEPPQRQRADRTKIADPPRLEVPKFSGRQEDYPMWKDLFQQTIHDNDRLSSSMKVRYLLASLQGNALELVHGFPVVGSSYDDIKTTLEEEYGNETVLRQQLYARLRTMRPASGDLAAIKKTVVELRQILRRLSTMGETINTAQMAEAVQHVLPAAMQPRLAEMAQEMAGNGKQMRTEDVIAFAERQIKAQATAEALYGSPTTINQMRRGAAPSFAITTDRQNHASPQGGRPPIETRFKGGRRERHQPKCLFCGEPHTTPNCTRVVTDRDRQKKMVERGLCTRCSEQQHEGHCTSTRFLCRRCPEKRAYTLCPQRHTKPATMAIDAGSNEATPIMLTKEVTVANVDDTCHRAQLFIFFDDGSAHNYIRKEVAEALQLQTLEEITERTAAFQGTTNEWIASRHEVAIRRQDGTYRIINVRATAQITRPLATMEGGKLRWREPDILIGREDYFGFIPPPKGSKVKDGLLHLQTAVGTVITGEIHHRRDQAANETTAVTNNERPGKVEGDLDHGNQLNDSDDEMPLESYPDLPNAPANAVITPKPQEDDKDILRKFWELEAIGIADDATQNDDEVAIEKVRATFKFVDGRYEVGFPWKDGQPTIGSNRGICMARLETLVSTLNRKGLLEPYHRVFEEQRSGGIIEVVDEREPVKGPIHYLTHHPVVKLDKATTKIRPVFNASLRDKSGRSLNDLMYQGPSLMPNLGGLMLRVRQPRVATTADVQRAFHQLSLRPEDRDSVRFVWIKNASRPTLDDNLLVYRFTRVPFGVISAPFMLNIVIRWHLEQTGTACAQEIANNIYADNVLMGAKDAAEMRRKCVDAKQIFAKAGMNLREYTSSDRTINREFADPDQGKVAKFLGITWKLDDDVFVIKTPAMDSAAGTTTTKRGILRALASCYDPAGFLAPALLPAKLLLQKLWELGLNWDEPLPAELALQWKTMTERLEKRNVRVPRHVPVDSTPPELHIFVDASKDAVDHEALPLRSIRQNREGEFGV